VYGTTYNWCVHHKKWTVHSPEECSINLADKAQVGEKPKQGYKGMTSVTEDDYVDAHSRSEEEEATSEESPEPSDEDSNG
jgi:hypothetical protein